VVAVARCEERSVSVAIEEVSKEEWAEKVYRPDILENEASLYRKPGYSPFKSF
jgi:4-oxalocrotonate tautomerase